MNTNNTSDVVVSVEVEVSLATQRETLRRKIHAQRELIENRLGPDRVENAAYPRSNTMRFFTQRPGLATKLAVELAGVFIGARFIKTVATAIGFAKNLR